MRHQLMDPVALGLLAQHVAWLRMRDLPETTIYTRNSQVMTFFRWVARWNGSPTQLTAEDLTRWHQSMRARKLQRTSIRNSMSNVREFYRWTVRAGHLDRDPTVGLILPRPRRGAPRPMREQLVQRALDLAPDADTRAAIALGGMAGLRSCEVARLSWRDVDLDGLMYVAGKGSRERVLKIADCAPLVAALAALPHRSGPVVRRRDGKSSHNTEGQMNRRMNRYLHEQAGIEETFHQLRHRAGTVAYQGTGDIVATGQMLGHASLQNTMIYTEAAAGSRSTGPCRAARPGLPGAAAGPDAAAPPRRLRPKTPRTSLTAGPYGSRRCDACR